MGVGVGVSDAYLIHGCGCGCIRYVGSAGAAASASDPVWGTHEDTMDRLTVELTWRDVPEQLLAAPPRGQSLGLEAVQHLSVACQFAEDLPCPLALALERFTELYLQGRALSSLRDMCDTADDTIKFALKRIGLSAPRDVHHHNHAHTQQQQLPPQLAHGGQHKTTQVLEALQAALEDTLPSDPEGYTIDGICVAEYRPSVSEREVARLLHLKAAPPGSLLSVLAKNMLNDAISSNLRYIALLWAEFVTEVRWFWEQGILLPRMPPAPKGPDKEAIDMSSCLIDQKLQLLNICIRKKIAAKADASVDRDDEIEFDVSLLGDCERSAIEMMGVPADSPDLSCDTRDADQEGSSAQGFVNLCRVPQGSSAQEQRLPPHEDGTRAVAERAAHAGAAYAGAGVAADVDTSSSAAPACDMRLRMLEGAEVVGAACARDGDEEKGPMHPMGAGRNSVDTRISSQRTLSLAPSLPICPVRSNSMHCM
jgi:hypothetical protein